MSEPPSNSPGAQPGRMWSLVTQHHAAWPAYRGRRRPASHAVVEWFRVSFTCRPDGRFVLFVCMDVGASLYLLGQNVHLWAYRCQVRTPLDSRPSQLNAAYWKTVGVYDLTNQLQWFPLRWHKTNTQSIFQYGDNQAQQTYTIQSQRGTTACTNSHIPQSGSAYEPWRTYLIWDYPSQGKIKKGYLDEPGRVLNNC